MNRRGFTVVELLIVITVMGILLILGMVNLRGTQISARDTERKTDIESIALHLEAFYKVGRDDSTIFGRYPSVAIAGNIQGSLQDADLRSFTPPGAADSDAGFLVATNSLQTTIDVRPEPTISTYVYQPLEQNGNLCLGASMCQKFNLYYKLESDGMVYIVTSKNQ